MKIEVLKIEMHHFKGVTEQVTNLNGNTCIKGGNGTGKSRHMEAFFWCLFGKDSLDRKDYEIKTYHGDSREASVKITLSVDGEVITLTRKLVERWETPKGCLEEIYKGNKTELFWDDVPVSATEYNKKVAELLTDKFKMLTNPQYFTEIMDAKQRRSVLLDMANVTNEELAEIHPEIAELFTCMGKYTEEEFKALLTVKMRPLRQTPEEIDIRISELKRTMPEQQDWNMIKAMKKDAEDVITQLQIEKSARLSSQGANIIDSQIAEAKANLSRIYAESVAEAQKYNAGVKAREKELLSAIQIANNEQNRFKKYQEQHNNYILECTHKLNSYKNEREALLNQLMTIRNESQCPTCGNPLNEEQLEKLLEPIVRQGKMIRSNIDSYETDIAKHQQYAEEEAKTSDKLQVQIEALTKLIAELPQLKNEIDVETPEHLQAESKMWKDKVAELELQKSQATSSTEDIDKQIEEQRRKVQHLTIEYANKLRIEDIKTRIRELTEQKESISIELAKWQRNEYLFNFFQLKRAELIQDRVNGMFEDITFQLYTTTLDGNMIPCCDPVVSGAVYGSANRASRLNAGLQVIAKLCDHYNIYAPIWIDNAECCNNILETESQQVRLYVTEDTQLVIS